MDIRIKITPEEAEELLKTIPGGKELFLHLADEFLKHYLEPQVATKGQTDD